MARAGKKQVQEMVRVLLALPEIPKPDDAADALAIAITHLHTRQLLIHQKNARQTIQRIMIKSSVLHLCIILRMLKGNS